MPKTLYTRLALGLFLLLVTVGLLYSVISWLSLREYVASVNQELHRDLAANLVQDRNLVHEGRIDEAALKELFELYMTINPSIEIYLLDPNGRILSYSADPTRIKRNSVSMAPIHKLLADMSAYPVLGDDPRSHDRRKIFSVTPIPSAANPDGYLYVVLRGEEFDMAEVMARNSHFVGMSAVAVLISLAVGMLAGLAVFRLLTRRLSHLTQLVERFETGDMAQPPQQTWQRQRPQVRDEIDYLGVAFDRMAERIANQIEELQEKDALRRRLVAQVSHDLRTPLASMQGYMESLKLKRASLSDREQEQFIEIALAEGRRLSRLVDELFELAALEAREKNPQPEPFPLPELLHDVAQKHGTKAADKRVTLAVEGDPVLPLAYGDLSMTERVLDNLIGNAIEYSPAGSTVTLTMGRQGPTLEVGVRDNGPGIPEPDLPHIFDAFYRGESGNASGHAGLGLAIAKRIMGLQGGRISVANLRPAGTAFTIELPISEKNGQFIDS